MTREVVILWWFIFGCTVLFPLGGGFFLWWACRLVRAGTPSYRRCWLAYTAAYFTASILATGFTFLVMSRPAATAVTVWDLPGWCLLTILFIALASHAILVPIVLGTSANRTLLAQGIGLLMYGCVLTAILTPIVLKAREQARRTVNGANLSQIIQSIWRYAEEHDNNFPPWAIYNPAGEPLLSWRVIILPYMDQKPLYEEFHLDEPWDSPHNVKLLPRMPLVYSSATPSGAGAYATHWQGFVQPAADALRAGRAAFVARDRNIPGFNPAISMVSFTDGSFHTLLLAEAAEAAPWSKPHDLNYTSEGPLPKLGALSDKGFQVLFADGSRRFIRNTADEPRIKAAITINGREELAPLDSD